MSSRSLNKVILIGNLTRDPELRYTPAGTAVCTFGLATNRSWKTDTGEKHDEAEFHNIVAWNKLAELCSQFLVKGRKVFVEGRLATRTWTSQDGSPRNRTEIVISDMILLDSNRGAAGGSSSPAAEETKVTEEPKVAEETKPSSAKAPAGKEEKKAVSKKKEEVVAEKPKEEVAPDDIPF